MPETRTVKLDVASRFEMLEIAQAVLAHLATQLGFDEEKAHYMSVAVRESVVNAIKHGNAMNPDKRVRIEFATSDQALEVTVQDEGRGFDPSRVCDPLKEENLLKADGRGIFFMRSFMDEVTYAFPPEGGTLVRMIKRL